MISRWKLFQEVVFPALQAQNKAYTEKRRKKFDDKYKVTARLPIGTKVMKMEDIKKRKTYAKYAGPYIVKQVDKRGAYTLEDRTGELLPYKVARNRLKITQFADEDEVDFAKHYEEFKSNLSKSKSTKKSKSKTAIIKTVPVKHPNKDIDKTPIVEQSYEIEKILDHKGKINDRSYFVHWKGYPDDENSWVHQSHIDTPEIIINYWKYVDKPKKDRHAKVIKSAASLSTKRKAVEQKKATKRTK